jgi:dipeptidyl aminopeptidase/acylaminoacyl peptidase
MKKLLATCLILAGFASLQAQDESALSWTPEQHMQFRSASQLHLSPDGKHAAYVVRTPVMEGEKSEYNSQIWVAALDGSFNYQYTRGEKSSTSPQFSPDGTQLAFLSDRNEKNQVFVMRLMGGEPEQITHEEKGVSAFQWSPDGQSFAYTATDPDSEEEKKRKQEKRDVILVDKQFKYRHLHTIPFAADQEGKRQSQRLTSGNFQVNSFDWSPDGTEIAFSHSPEPTFNTSFLESDISAVPADSGAVQEIVKRPGIDQDPHYSPDGQTIAFVTSGGKAEPIGLADLALVQREGGKVMALPYTPNRSSNIIDWQADGKGLVIAEPYKTSVVAMAVSIPSKLNEDRTSMGNIGEAKPRILGSLAGTAGSFAMNKKGQLGYTYQTPDQPMEVYLADADGQPAQKLSAVNTEVAIPAMGKTELINWKSSHDGMEIEGLLTYPIGYEKGKKYPIILQIHGGPAGVFTKSFTGGPSIYMTQFFASKGFFVLRPNPRGSTGYGKDFRFANFKDWGYGDYEDLVSGVDHVIKEGMADKDQQYVMGWSYGGYMTSFVVTRTDRFRAASMGAGLPNLVSMVTTTDIPDYLAAHMGEEFFNDYETYEKHSAIYHIKKVKTPTQVIHGQNDLRVPFTQGQEFYVALKRLGVDTEMVVYPRTPHGPREPKFLMDVSQRILTWFEQY